MKFVKKVIKKIARQMLVLCIKIDKKVMHGKVDAKFKNKDFYMRLQGKLQLDDFFHGEKELLVEQAVADFIVMQHNRDYYGKYTQCDLAVLVLFIEEYYKKNHIGKELYGKFNSFSGYGKSNDTGENNSADLFINQIMSVEERGFDERTGIKASKKLINMNGSHSLALAWYKNIEFVDVYVLNIEKYIGRYTWEWFWGKEFTKDELQIMDRKLTEIIKSAKQAIGSFYYMLFPPAYNYFDEIIEDLKIISPNNVKVKSFSDYKVEKADFEGLMRTLYGFDCIKKSDLERKLRFIGSATDLQDGKMPYRIVELDIDDPMYSLKIENGKPESMVVADIKNVIRTRYRNRDPKLNIQYEEGFNHDRIIHSTDNYLSNNGMRQVLSIDRDLSELFEQFKGLEYVVIERGKDKISELFPRNFYLNEDIDILIKKEDVEKFIRITKDFCSKHFNQKWISIQTEMTDNGAMVSVKLKGVLIILFDFVYEMSSLKEEFLKTLLSNHKGEDVRIVSEEEEAIFRIAKYFQSNGTKVHHMKYVRQNLSNVDINWTAFGDLNQIKKIIMTESSMVG